MVDRTNTNDAQWPNDWYRNADVLREFWKAKHVEGEAPALTVRLVAAAFDVTVDEAEARARELGLIPAS